MRLGLKLVTVLGGVCTGVGCVLGLKAQSAPTVSAWEKPIAPGLVFREEVDYASHHSVFILRLSLESTAVRPSPVLAGGKTYKNGNLTSRLPVSKIVSDEEALAGVNGDFFSFVNAPSGDPLGVTISDGRLLSTPSKRVAFGWGPAEARMSTVSFAGSVSTKSAEVKIDGINRRCPNNQITLDTADAGLALADGNFVEVRIRLSNPVWLPSTAIRGRVITVSAEPDHRSIGPNEAVLIARGNKIDSLNQLSAGSECYLKLKTTGFDWEKIDSVIGGGPALVRDGQVAVDGEAEGFGKEFVENRHPRTAIGRTANNDILLVAVDGRQETGDGMSLEELALLMQKMGCIDAMNLDGGGSTTMNVLGVTVNRPSDGKERAVADAIVIRGPRPNPSTDPLTLSLPTEISGPSPTLAQVLDGTSPVPNLDVMWGASGACAIDAGGMIKPLRNGAATITAFCRGQLLNQHLSVVDKER